MINNSLEWSPKRAAALLQFGHGLARKILFVLFLISMPFSQAANGPEFVSKLEGQETLYIWKRGDTLSRALYNIGLGRHKGAMQLYGSTGWVARNNEFYKGKKWEDILPGSRVNILIPKGFTALNPPMSEAASQMPSALTPKSTVSSPTTLAPKPFAPRKKKSAPVRDASIEKALDELGALNADDVEDGDDSPMGEKGAVALVPPTPAIKPVTTRAPDFASPEGGIRRVSDETPTESVDANQEPERLVQKDEATNPEVSDRAKKKPAKKILKLKIRPLISKDIVFIICLVFASSLGLFQLSQERRKRNQKSRLTAAANSFLSWLVLGGTHQPEHIAMSETLFVGSVKSPTLDTYELMGYLGKDIEIIRALDTRVRSDSSMPAVDYQLDPLQDEYLVKFMTLSPAILCRIIALASSSFLQVSVLKVVCYRFARNPDAEAASGLVKAIVDVCRKYPVLGQNSRVRGQLLETISTLEMPSSRVDSDVRIAS